MRKLGQWYHPTRTFKMQMSLPIRDPTCGNHIIQKKKFTKNPLGAL